jgi:hypothetical protein
MSRAEEQVWRKRLSIREIFPNGRGQLINGGRAVFEFSANLLMSD